MIDLPPQSAGPRPGQARQGGFSLSAEGCFGRAAGTRIEQMHMQRTEGAHRLVLSDGQGRFPYAEASLTAGGQSPPGVKGMVLAGRVLVGLKVRAGDDGTHGRGNAGT